MIINIEEHFKCTFGNCLNDATNIVAGKNKTRCYNYDEPDFFCEEHAGEVLDRFAPEFEVKCPNCKCEFGVN